MASGMVAGGTGDATKMGVVTPACRSLTPSSTDATPNFQGLSRESVFATATAPRP